MPNNETLIGRKYLQKAVVAVAALMMTAGVFASAAYAATIHGTDGSDTIYGRKGWDYLAAYRGADVVHGGPGMEIIQGVTGDDRIFGERGHDFGGSGNDRIYLQDGHDEAGNVEQVSGDGGRDLCVVDEDPKDGVIVNVSCETLVIESVAGMSGATKIYNTRKAKDRGDTIPGEFYPGTDHLN